MFLVIGILVIDLDSRFLVLGEPGDLKGNEKWTKRPNFFRAKRENFCGELLK